MLQLADKFISELRTMLLFSVLVVPNNCAAPLLNDSSIDVLTILIHDLLDTLHPLLVLNLEQFIPLLLLLLDVVATLSCHPEVLLVHQV